MNSKRGLLKSHPYKYSTIFLLSLSRALKMQTIFFKEISNHLL
ncbi:hypothetical protein GCWU000323_01928 [Leptotrichia hofstadii F0254]|uniref:Uncharacterized protein n=1 Tax=Leptotrichia hofstadii F0254 TaxID=634994 RepID=C9MZD1_9FUSO|nr:hypothetical protein GCWU000323_01928 [Leptotrichia hofstadii F0254]